MTASFYLNKDTFLVAVDCIIMGFRDNDLHILIARRPFEPLKGGWSLMGGFVNAQENIQESAKRVVGEYTGINDIYLEQVGAYGEIDRDVERVISVVYYALVDIEKFDTSLAEKYDARWIRITQLPELVFDHNKMVRDTIKLLQQRASVKPIGFNLLGDQFTLPTLQSLYESIYQEPIDKRNFRKKLLTMDILEKLEEKDKNTSKKGAFYYKYNKEKYDQLIQQGLHFSL
ncbi:MAG: NUDIX domain-containing protein [Bacteroidota bacterium]|nr:NUDIX domain-containing protein [Bacteroidota bacterium]